MCDPAAIAIGSLVVSAVGSVAKAKAQNDAAAQNKANVISDLTSSSAALTTQETQKQDQATQTIQQADRSARSTQAIAQVSAGAAGVEGISVQALMGDIDNKLGQFKSSTAENLTDAVDQLQQEKINDQTVGQERINNVQPANPLALGLNLAGDGLSFWAGQISRAAPKG